MTFGKEAGDAPRYVDWMCALNHCSNWVLGFFAPIPVVMFACVWVYAVTDSRVALYILFVGSLYVVFFILIWLRQKRMLSNGAAVQGVINEVDTYGRGDGRLVFSRYLTVRYSYQYEEESYGDTWIVEASELKGKDVQPSAGRKISLVLDQADPEKSYVWT